MPSEQYIALFPNPPDSPCRSQHDDNVQSDFDPCRINDSTPDPLTPPRRRPSRYHRKQCSPHQSQPPKTGLGAKNIVNNIQVTVEQPKVTFRVFIVGDTKSLLGCSEVIIKAHLEIYWPWWFWPPLEKEMLRRRHGVARAGGWRYQGAHDTDW